MPADQGPADDPRRLGDEVSGEHPVKLPVLTLLVTALVNWWGRLFGRFSRAQAPNSSDDAQGAAKP
jgi:hypothetical protein